MRAALPFRRMPYMAREALDTSSAPMTITPLPRTNPAIAKSRGLSRSMGSALRPNRVLRSLASVALLVALYLLFAPTQLGGSASFVITDGISMLPTYHAGDLVVLKSEPEYHVGEVAGYHNRQLGVVVLHRIVAIHGGHYVFKGDNNPYPTSDEPTQQSLVGAEWIHIPSIGKLMRLARVPGVAAVLLAALWLFSFSSSGRTRRQRRRHRGAL